jgi:hypothetical protein
MYCILHAKEIADFTRSGIARIKDIDLREALDRVYRESQSIETTETAQRAFTRLTSQAWSPTILSRFLSSWQSTHGTSQFVSGLIVRLQREAQSAGKVNREAATALCDAAAEMGEIIAEDTGVDDIPHNERFYDFATEIVGNDAWQAHHHHMPACLEMRRFVKQQRLTGDIEDAILTTMASENWNSGEYTFLDPLVTPWMIEVLGRKSNAARRAAAYVKVHAGETELGHFLHSITAWKRYCKAVGRTAEPAKAAYMLRTYLGKTRAAFAELETLFI